MAVGGGVMGDGKIVMRRIGHHAGEDAHRGPAVAPALLGARRLDREQPGGKGQPNGKPRRRPAPAGRGTRVLHGFAHHALSNTSIPAFVKSQTSQRGHAATCNSARA